MTILSRVAAVAVILWLGLGVVFPALDRANRTQVLEGVPSDGPIHVARDGRIITVDAAGGRILAVDPNSAHSSVVLEGLTNPRAADMSSDGTVCAADQGAGGAILPALRCSDGRTIDLSVVRASFSEVGNTTGSDLADVVSNGSGWFVSDTAKRIVIRVNQGGGATVADFFPPCDEWSPPPAPLGLAVGADQLVWVALGHWGARVVQDVPASGCGPFTYLGSDDTVAIIPRYSIPIVLTRIGTTGNGAIHWHPGGDAANQDIVSDIRDPRGAALLPDGRIVISTDGALVLYRPALLPG